MLSLLIFVIFVNAAFNESKMTESESWGNEELNWGSMVIISLEYEKWKKTK